MRITTFILLTHLITISLRAQLPLNDTELGGIKLLVENEKRQAHLSLEGQLYLNGKPNKFKTDSSGGFFIKEICAGKYTVELKTDKCCRFIITDFPIYKNKITYAVFTIPPRGNPEDTCTKRVKYEYDQIDPSAVKPGTIRREYLEKNKNKSMSEVLEEQKK